MTFQSVLMLYDLHVIIFVTLTGTVFLHSDHDSSVA